MRPRTTRLYGVGAAVLSAMLALATPAVAAGETKNDDNGGKVKTAAAQGAEAWGNNRTGQAGVGIIGAEYFTAVPVEVPDGVRAVSAGGGFGLALLRNRTVKSWGINLRGQLGNSTATADPQGVPGNVFDLANVKAISAGQNHSLALLTNGVVMSWGANDRGQLGNGTTDDGLSPVTVTSLAGQKVIAIAAGDRFSLALLSNGTLKSWGDNSLGQLGIGSVDTNPHSTPIDVTGLTGVRVTAIDAGIGHSLAALANGGVRGWGLNNFGQVGTGNTVSPQPRPVDVVDLTGVRVKAVAAGDGFSLALRTSGRIKGWGINSHGELGNGTFVSPQLRPVDTVGLTGVTAISAGSQQEGAGGHSLAIAGRTVQSWGLTTFGQLGNGGVNRNVPKAVVTGLDKPLAVSAGEEFSLAS